MYVVQNWWFLFIPGGNVGTCSASAQKASQNKLNRRMEKISLLILHTYVHIILSFPPCLQHAGEWRGRVGVFGLASNTTPGIADGNTTCKASARLACVRARERWPARRYSRARAHTIVIANQANLKTSVTSAWSDT